MLSIFSAITALLNAAGSNLRVMGLPQAAEASGPYGPAIFQCKLLASPAIVNTIIVAEQAVTLTGLVAGDIVMSVNKPTINGAIGVLTGRAAANSLKLTFVNPTAGNVTPTAGEVYDVLIFRPAL